MSKQDEEGSGKERQVGYVVYPWELDEFASADQVLPMLERLYYLGFTPVISTVYLKSTNFFTWDRQIEYSLIKKCDVMLLLHEDRMTPLMLRALLKGREYGKPVVRIGRKAD